VGCFLIEQPEWQFGHHLQIAIAQEFGGVPNGANYTAFVEGWGLHSESLDKTKTGCSERN
jgi:uncharacterized protein (DUF885 family)